MQLVQHVEIIKRLMRLPMLENALNVIKDTKPKLSSQGNKKLWRKV